MGSRSTQDILRRFLALFGVILPDVQRRRLDPFVGKYLAAETEDHPVLQLAGCSCLFSRDARVVNLLLEDG